MKVGVSEFSPISLGELDERAALLERVDRKYVIEREQYAAMIGELEDDHDVLEIDGRREFLYESVYFDTPDLRCFHDHVDGREPRFKARTRFYADTGVCVFEVKLKREDGETDKRQMDYSAQQRDRLTPDAAAFLDHAVRECGIALRGDMSASLTTTFRRVTFAHRHGAARVTCDFDVTLSRCGSAVRLRQDLVVVETKTEDGDSPADRILARMGIDEVPFSKYRTGIALLTDEDGGAGGAERFFEPG